jgi:putative endonuclease
MPGPSNFRRATASNTQKRQRALASGLRAETLAAAFLYIKGYRILARRYAISGAEIDLIARKGDSVAFIEVKTRPDMAVALISIDTAKCRRISKAASHWLAHNPWAMRCNLRGDAVYLSPWRWPQHAIAALPLDIG